MAKPKKVTARALVAFVANGVSIPADAVVVMTDADAKTRVEGGSIDPHADAVAYSRSQGAPEFDLTGGE